MYFIAHRANLSKATSTTVVLTLLLLAFACLAGCAMTHPKKSANRAATVHGEKFSCGEQCPKGRSL